MLNKLKELEIQNKPIQSQGYLVKDIARASFICKTAEHTIKIFNALIKPNKNFRILEIKNDFRKNKANTEYRDIKIIFATTFDDYNFDQLVEVQIIQKQ